MTATKRERLKEAVVKSLALGASVLAACAGVEQGREYPPIPQMGQIGAGDLTTKGLARPLAATKRPMAGEGECAGIAVREIGRLSCLPQWRSRRSLEETSLVEAVAGVFLSGKQEVDR
jgi:hypothetical protein